MRLIDADAEIAKIEQKIQRMEEQIKEFQRIEEQIKESENREDHIGYYYVDAKIKRLRMRISDARSEIKSLERYSTAYDVDKVVEQLKESSMSFMGDLYDRDVDLETAIEFVKAGGVNE